MAGAPSTSVVVVTVLLPVAGSGVPLDATPAVFSEQTLGDARRLQEAALKSDYAWRQVAHLSNNIGPRLSGSIQAAKAVAYVSDELRALGCDVQLEKTMVPHWVRGEERAELTRWSGRTMRPIPRATRIPVFAAPTRTR